MALSVEDAAWLVELKTARRKVILGQQPASISSGGRSISFVAMTAEQALARIDDEIAVLEAADAGDGTIRRRGSMRFAIKS